MRPKSKQHPAAQAAAGASELMKKALTIGVGALVLSEDGIKGLLADIKLPKELLSGILDSANKSKKEFLQGLSQDIISRIQEKIDPMAFVQEFLSKNEVELKINISVKPKAQRVAQKSPKADDDLESS
jgi:hypothetical protein